MIFILVYILYVVVPLALHNTLDMRRADRVRTLGRCAFVVIAYYAAVAFRMTSMCGINRRNFIPLSSLAKWLSRLRVRVGIVMRRSGVRSPAKAYKRFRALLPRISSVSSLNLTQLTMVDENGWIACKVAGPPTSLPYT